MPHSYIGYAMHTRLGINGEGSKNFLVRKDGKKDSKFGKKVHSLQIYENNIPFQDKILV
jgi:hypothetical protein